MIQSIIAAQRAFFDTGATRGIRFRMDALKKLHRTLVENESALAAALKADLGKSPSESYMCEIGMVISELRYMMAHIRRFAREQTVPTPLAQFPARSYRKPCPYGVTLIMSPWNYPVLLTLGPLISALSAGNTAVIKPSAYSPATTALLEEKFDYIFFTGGKNVGKLVLEKAARHLTPVTLELGGKSPCIVDRSANLKMAARRIVFGKFLNCGQTCVAPDYVLVHSAVREEFLAYVKAEIRRQYHGAEYGKIINSSHFHRIIRLIDPEKVIIGGEGDPDTRQILPTVMDRVTWDDAVMEEEIFGPILPVLTFETMDDVIHTVNSREKPLALYIFAEDQRVVRRVTAACAYGGGCVNDCVIHLASSRLGFGGVGESGMGSYHGKAGFDTFTHYKSIVDKKTWLDLPMRYQPYNKFNDLLIHIFLR